MTMSGMAGALPRLREPAVLVSRLALGGVLLAAGLLKVGDPVNSVLAVRAYELLPDEVARYVGYALPWAEVALGVLLLIGLGTRLAAAVSGLLMLAFVVGISSAWARGLSIDCGCFGGGGEVDPTGKNWRYASEILRDLLLVGMACLLVLTPDSRLSVDRWMTRPHEGENP